MMCPHFGACGSCTLHAYDYEGQLALKTAEFRALFDGIDLPSLEIIRSSDGGFRTRAEFRIWRDGERLSYAMRALDGGNRPLPVASCAIVDGAIAGLMAPLLETIAVNAVLKERLFEVNFLASRDDGVLVTLIYHRKLGEEWREAARALAARFGIKVIGRSRGQKEVLSDDFVVETLTIGGRDYRYRYIENSFTQPNRGVNERMIAWAREAAVRFGAGDLVELYCGAGNFTIPLAGMFPRVLATEISKASIAAATENCRLNGIGNIAFIRLSSEEFVEAVNGVRPFRRLAEIDLADYSRRTLFVDPPRAGLDRTTRDLAKTYDTVLYVSCSPQTLRRDLDELCATHDIVSAAVFDQFPYTRHLESGVVLVRRGASQDEASSRPTRSSG